MLIPSSSLLFNAAFILFVSRGITTENIFPDILPDILPDVIPDIFKPSQSSTESKSESISPTKTQEAKPNVTTNTSSKVTQTTTSKTIETTAKISFTTSASSTDVTALTDLPTLTGGYTIVSPSVPPTQNAPYMQHSSLPEGTVFIVVGATLGFLAVSVLAWRMGVAWCLHRSVNKSAFSQNMSDTKVIYRSIGTPSAPNVPFYKYSDRSSSLSLSGLGNKSGKKGNKSGVAQTNSKTSNLFFSPTAGAGIQNSLKSGSNYFPAGYYSAGASTPGNTVVQMLSGGPGISLSNLSVQSQGYSRPRSFEPSPPDSPMTRPESNKNYHANASILSLTQTNGGSDIAPSAYLEDLFDGDNAGQQTHINSDRQVSRGSNATKSENI